VKYWITIYDASGKRGSFHQVEEYDAREFGGPGIDLIPAPFKEGAMYYPIDLMLSVLQSYCDDFFDNEIELVEVISNFKKKWNPGKQ
jgi:hypothetical protein